MVRGRGKSNRALLGRKGCCTKGSCNRRKSTSETPNIDRVALRRALSEAARKGAGLVALNGAQAAKEFDQWCADNMNRFAKSIQKKDGEIRPTSGIGRP